MHYPTTCSDYSVKIRPCLNCEASKTAGTETCGRAGQNQRSNGQVFFNFHHAQINLTVPQFSQRASGRQSSYREQCTTSTEFDLLKYTEPEYRYEMGANSLNANESSEDKDAWDDWFFPKFEHSVRIWEFLDPEKRADSSPWLSCWFDGIVEKDFGYIRSAVVPVPLSSNCRLLEPDEENGEARDDEYQERRKVSLYIQNQQQRWSYRHISGTPHMNSQATRHAEWVAMRPHIATSSRQSSVNLWGKDTISAWKSLSGASKEWRSLPLSRTPTKSSPMRTSNFPLETYTAGRHPSSSCGLPLIMLRKLGKPKSFFVPRRKPPKSHPLSWNVTPWDEEILDEDTGSMEDFDKFATGEVHPLININNLTGTIINSQIKLLFFKNYDQYSQTYAAKNIHKEAAYDIRVYYFGMIGPKEKRVLKHDCAYWKKSSPSFLDSWRRGDLVFLAFLVSETRLSFDIKNRTAFPPLMSSCVESRPNPNFGNSKAAPRTLYSKVLPSWEPETPNSKKKEKSPAVSGAPSYETLLRSNFLKLCRSRGINIQTRNRVTTEFKTSHQAAGRKTATENDITTKKFREIQWRQDISYKPSKPYTGVTTNSYSSSRVSGRPSIVQDPGKEEKARLSVPASDSSFAKAGKSALGYEPTGRPLRPEKLEKPEKASNTLQEAESSTARLEATTIPKMAVVDTTSTTRQSKMSPKRKAKSTESRRRKRHELRNEGRHPKEADAVC